MKQIEYPETHYPALIVRVNHSGHLCGYVGLAPGHSVYLAHYDSLNIQVHGGLTFAHGCADTSENAWQQMQQQYERGEAEAKRYPIGDAARFRGTWKRFLGSYSDWKVAAQARFICHLPESNEPDNLWWLGFDCAHPGDLSPRMNELLPERKFRIPGEIYRDIEYVKHEIRSLAKQLKQMKT